MEAARAPDMALQRGLAALQRVEASHGIAQQADVADGRYGRERGQKICKEGKNLGIGGFRISAVKDLEPGLKIFRHARATVVLFAEDLAQIAIAGGVGAMRHMRLHHRHGEIRAQHHLAAQRVRGDIGAGADVLAIEVQERLGRL